MCAACHRLDGRDRGIGSIVGLDQQKFTGLMEAFRSGKRSSQIMNVVARTRWARSYRGARGLSRCPIKRVGTAMNCWTRRQVGCLAGAVCLTAIPRVAKSLPKARVVVIGGGIGGATVAKYLAMMGGTIEVTLVEPKPRYTTCFFSNLYLAGIRTLESLTHGYEALAQRYGVNIIHDFASAIDPVGKTVALKNGATLPYDRLVLASGIEFKFDVIDGYDEAAMQVMPAAWLAVFRPSCCGRQLVAWRMAAFS